jgi:hypothetical protein
MGPNPASIGVGTPPNMPGAPPPPTGKGAIPTGAPGKTKIAAGGEAISGLRNLQGFVPEMLNQINEWINQIKQATVPKQGDDPGPAAGQPGVPGTLQLDGSQLMDSGSPGSM